jgi:hypothetical protein
MTRKTLGAVERITAIVAATAIVAGASYRLSAHDDDEGGRASYTVGLFGDMPYNALGKEQYPACSPTSTAVTSRSPCSTAT